MTNDRGLILDQIRRVFEGGAVGTLSDRELLERFRAGEDGAAGSAFASLVDRHGPMVLGVCRRHLVDPNDADDAFQATFVVLARKAGSLEVDGSIGPWLHGVSIRVASVIRSRNTRRRLVEAKAGRERGARGGGAAADDLGPAIHQEIERLPARLRAAVVLCLLEGLTQDEAAARLGWPSGTVRSRLARGRERLRGRLLRRGLAPAAALAGSEAVSAALVDMAVRTALPSRVGSSLSAVANASVIEASSLVIRSLSMSRFKIVAALLLATVVAAAGVEVFARQRPDAPAAAAKGEPARAPTPRWNHKLVRLIMETEIAEKANEEAAKGWEVLQVVPYIHGIGGQTHTQYTILFRRPADVKE